MFYSMTEFNAWLVLIAAGICEVIWAYFMKLCEGFTKFVPTMLFLLFNILSSIFLGLAVEVLPISISYPIWVGIGAIGTVFIGIIFFKEGASLKKISCTIAILIGIIGVKFV